MVVAERGDLREVRDAEHLAMARDVGDGAADDLGDRAADAGVDLVEDVEAGRALLGEHALQREQRARELAAARDLAERARVLALVRRDEELDAIDAARGEARAVDGRELAGLRRGHRARRRR